MMNKLMKKIAVVLTVATMAVAATTAVASANDGLVAGATTAINVRSTYEVRYVSGVEDALNVRVRPNTNAQIIGALTNGQQVEVTGYVEEGCVGNYIDWVEISFNGGKGFVNSAFLSYSQPVVTTVAAQETQTTAASTTVSSASVSSVATTASAVNNTVVYPRVDKHLSGANGETWCSLNTDGCFYNEVGARYTDNGNGTFSDVYGNILTVLNN